jgi:hypothetical protein
MKTNRIVRIKMLRRWLPVDAKSIAFEPFIFRAVVGAIEYSA